MQSTIPKPSSKNLSVKQSATPNARYPATQAQRQAARTCSSVKGLAVYAVRNGNSRFFGAWIERSGVFIGWMRIQPHISGIDSDYAVGEVLQRPVFMGITLDLSGQ